METKLTKEEMTALAPYELEMRSAKEGYLRSAGREGLAIMHKVYERVTGEPYTETDACGHCQLKLQGFIADWYFKTKEENASVPKMVREGEKENAPRTKAPAKGKNAKK